MCVGERERLAEVAMGRWLGSIGVMLILTLDCSAGARTEALAAKGRELLERNCGRCHAVAADQQSRKSEAPNLWIVLGAWPSERLDVELAEGVGSHHPEMPQIQFSDDDITSIYYYLHGREPDGPERRP
jgi:cytochrome c